MSIHILGVDPGFAYVGLVVVKLRGLHVFVKHAEVFTTKKASKKQRVLATDDNLHRAKQIARRLSDLDKLYRIRGIAAEAMSFPRNASAAAKVSLCWGVLSCFSEVANVPILQARPQEIRAALGLKPVKGETKGDKKTKTQAKLNARFGKFVSRVAAAGIPKSQHEHVYDALAAAVACIKSPEIQWARSLSEGA